MMVVRSDCNLLPGWSFGLYVKTADMKPEHWFPLLTASSTAHKSVHTSKKWFLITLMYFQVFIFIITLVFIEDIKKGPKHPD